MQMVESDEEVLGKKGAELGIHAERGRFIGGWKVDNEQETVNRSQLKKLRRQKNFNR